MKVYCISGIAADKRAFRHLRLPAGYEDEYISWIKPFRKESLHQYALRLTEQINAREPFCLVGISLGGIMATEIAIYYKPRTTIIIGSVPVYSQLPPYYDWMGRLKVHKLVPGILYKFGAITKHFFTVASAEDKQVIYKMAWESDPAFIRWGINAVLNWTNEQIPESLIHIHGTRDEIFPFTYTKPTHTIPKGDHMLIISHPDEINSIISEAFSRLHRSTG